MIVVSHSTPMFDRETLSAKYWLDPDVSFADNHGYNRHELRDIERLIRANLETLQHGWDVFCHENPGPTSRIRNVIITDDTLAVDLDDGRTIAVPIGWYPRLAYGTAAERANFQISGGGYGLHWPDLEEDCRGRGSVARQEIGRKPASFAAWLAQRQSKVGAA